MTIKLMRGLDRWLGVPLCFLLSLLLRVFAKIRPGNRDRLSNPQKILFMEFPELGSAILSYPALKKARDCYPKSELYYWIFEANYEAVSVLNIVPEANIIKLRTKNVFVFVLDLFRNLKRIRREKMDVVIDLELFSRFSSIMTFLSGAPVRAGFYGFGQKGVYRGDLHTHKVAYNSYIHISRNFISLVKAIGAKMGDIPKVKMEADTSPLFLPKVLSTKEQQEQIWSKIKNEESSIPEGAKIVVMHLGLGDPLPLRRWGLDEYLKLADDLLGNQDVFVVLVGALHGVLGPEILARLQKPRMINLIGKTTFQELIALFNISRILVSHDGGMIHIASLTEVYIISFFGPETPSLYAPLTENGKIFYKNYCCSPCLTAFNYRRSFCDNNKCLKAISVEEVSALIYRNLMAL